MNNTLKDKETEGNAYQDAESRRVWSLKGGWAKMTKGPCGTHEQQIKSASKDKWQTN